ncbi:MAG: hypothetical protein F4Z31_07765 [Gemmatimonadetes bacterium]|nr:hypothetical protein [Gemmatimonadota bacterium]
MARRALIANYTATVPARHSFAQLRDLLAGRGATDVRMIDHGAAGLIGVSFSIGARNGVMCFAMLVDANRTFRSLTDRGVLAGDDKRRREWAERVAWRNISEWIGAAGGRWDRDGAA